MRLRSPAKVNLCLYLLKKLKDGYHEIFSIMQEIDLYDEIILEEGRGLRVITEGVREEENLIYKVLKEFERKTGYRLNLKVEVLKRIPIGGGLGGGSSNCAVLLKFVNEFYKEPLSFKELKELLSKFSKDAVFFLYGGSAIVRGRGEEIIPLKGLKSFKITLICPKLRVSTKRVYENVKEEDLTPNINQEEILRKLLKGQTSHLENRLGMVSLRLYPKMKEVYERLKGKGYRVLVSGSGSCLFTFGHLKGEVLRDFKDCKVFRVLTNPRIGL